MPDAYEIPDGYKSIRRADGPIYIDLTLVSSDTIGLPTNHNHITIELMVAIVSHRHTHPRML